MGFAEVLLTLSFWRMVMLIRKHRVVAHTLERAFEREDLAIRDSEPLLQIPLADIFIKRNVYLLDKTPHRRTS